MPKPSVVLFPSSVRALEAFGGRLKDARLRRHMSAELVAARAGITRQTLTKIEQGGSSVTMGNYLRVLGVLGMEADLGLLAADDVLGRRLQDLELPQRRRAPRQSAAKANTAPVPDPKETGSS